MSSSGRKSKERGGEASPYRPLADYYTPDELARVLVAQLPLATTIRPEIILEPHVGGGAFLRAIVAARAGLERSTRLFACDLNPEAQGLREAGQEGAVTHAGDFMRWTPPAAPTWIIGNPPFGVLQVGKKRAAPIAHRHIQRAMDLVGPGGHIAFLFRWGLFEGRDQFWAKAMPRVVWTLTPRPDFTGDGGDSTPYCFAWWTKGWHEETVLRRLRWRDPR